MGLFNYLFGDKESRAKELNLEAERRIQIFEDLIKKFLDKHLK